MPLVTTATHRGCSTSPCVCIDKAFSSRPACIIFNPSAHNTNTLITPIPLLLCNTSIVPQPAWQNNDDDCIHSQPFYEINLVIDLLMISDIRPSTWKTMSMQIAENLIFTLRSLGWQIMSFSWLQYLPVTIIHLYKWQWIFCKIVAKSATPDLNVMEWPSPCPNYVG
jgi:hypothetical protein